MISINMLSKADSVKGQGVLSAHDEQVNLVKKELLEYNIIENKMKFCKIMHFHTINPEFFFMIPFAKRKGKTVAYVHFVPETLEKSIKLSKSIKKIFYKYIIRFYKMVDYLVVVNPYFINVLAKYGIDKNKITYIPNFVSSKNFYKLDAEKKLQIRKRYNLSEEKFTVLSVGQLQTRKGVLDFIEIAKKMPNIQFVWAGGAVFGKISEGYKQIKEAISNDLPENVKFLGVIDREKMNDIYNMADVMFLPSYDELFPMTILEAMCVDIPILIRDLDIYENILFDFYLSGKNNEDFISAINKLNEDNLYYKEAVRKSSKGHTFYSEENVARMWRDFYGTIATNKEQ